jgi:hypothetical protein
MNERIKEIALNTNDACEHLGCSDIGEEWIEKFAELIVRECANEIENYQPRYLTRGQAQEMANTIRKNLGVEK